MSSTEQLRHTAVTKQCPACRQSYALTSLSAVPSHDCPQGASTSTQTDKPDEILIGATLDERYRIDGIIDTGGMGVVYRGRHALLGSLVAIKVLHQRKQTTNLQRFFREAKLASKLRHPNIVYIHDFGILPGGVPFFVMELLGGSTLAKVIEAGAMDPRRVCDIGVQLARGMQVVHDAGIIHRDLKPENIILLDGNGNYDLVKIIDFGLAKEMVAATENLTAAAVLLAVNAAWLGRSGEAPVLLTRAGAFLGSPRYMAPEQAKGEDVNALCDQYSLGCIFYQMLTGTLPFQSDTPVGLLTLHVQAAVEPLRKRVPGLAISDGLEALVLRLLSKNPEERFASMRALEEALSHELGLAGSAPVSKLPRLMQLTLVGILIASVVGIAGYLIERWARRRPVLSTTEVQDLHRQAIMTLQGLTGSPLQPVRASALRTLGLSHDGAIRPLLEAALKDEQPPVRSSACEGLGLLGDRSVIPTLTALLGSQEVTEVKMAAAQALENLGEPKGRTFLVQALHSPDGKLRTSAALELCGRGGTSVRETFDKLRKAGPLPAATELSVLGCLTQAGDADARATLQARLAQGSSWEARLNAAGQLVRAGDPSGHEFLRGILRRAGEQRLVAARLLASPAEPETAEVFRQVLADSQAAAVARYVAAEGLGRSGELADLRLLGDGLRPAVEPSLRIAAAGSILQLSAHEPSLLSQETLTWLDGRFSDPSELVRQAGVDVLSEDPRHDVVPALIELLNDHESAVRQRVVYALGRRPTPAVIPRLRQALGDADPAVRLTAIRALGQALTATAGGRPEALTQLKHDLQPTLTSGSALEMVMASSQLYQLGDDGQLPALLSVRDSKVVEERLAVVKENPRAPRLLVEYLKDPEWEVRWAAARGLGEQGDHQATAVLQEALRRKGPESLAAFYWLRRLDETPPSAAGETLLETEDVGARLRVLDATLGLPNNVVEPLLQRAARDPEPLVRLKVVTLVGERLNTLEPPALLNLLQGMVDDETLIVRVRAGAIISRLSYVSRQTQDKAQRKDQKEPLPPLRLGIAPPSRPVPTAETDDKQVTLTITAPVAVWFRIDRRPWQQAAGASVRLPSGEHTLTTLNETRTLALTKAQQVQLPESAIEALVNRGRRAIKDKDLRLSQRVLERALAACARDHNIKQPCQMLSSNLSVHLAAVYEEQGLWADAMREYQRIKTGGAAESAPELDATIRRVGAHLGEVVVVTKVKRHCSERSLWLPPGSHTVTQRKLKFTVEVRAQQVVRVGSCR